MNDNLELIFNEIKEKLKEQLQVADQIAVKFNFILAFSGIILASIIQTVFSSQEEKPIGFLLIVSIFLFLLVAIYSLLGGLLMKKYRSDPNPEKLYSKYKDKKIDETAEVLIENYIDSFEHNSKILSKSKEYFQFAVKISFIALVFIFLFIIKNNLIIIWETITKTICQR